jgi:hypothetical protein
MGERSTAKDAADCAEVPRLLRAAQEAPRWPSRDAEAEMTDAEVAECRGRSEVRDAEPRCRAEMPSLRKEGKAEGRSLNKSRDVKSHVTVVTKVTVMKDPIT